MAHYGYLPGEFYEDEGEKEVVHLYRSGNSVNSTATVRSSVSSNSERAQNNQKKPGAEFKSVAQAKQQTIDMNVLSDIIQDKSQSLSRAIAFIKSWIEGAPTEKEAHRRFSEVKLFLSNEFKADMLAKLKHQKLSSHLSVIRKITTQKILALKNTGAEMGDAKDNLVIRKFLGNSCFSCYFLQLNR